MSLMTGRDQETLDRAHAVYCPFCAAEPGQWCRTRTGGLTYPHQKRRTRALTAEARRVGRHA